MTSQQFKNLVDIGQIKQEPGDQKEFDGLLHSGRTQIKDSRMAALSLESRFDLAYNAAHALSLAALRWHGYRSENCYIVFQCLQHTIGAGPEVWRVLAHCHNLRNRGEYEGLLEVSERLVLDLIQAAEAVLDEVEKLGEISSKRDIRRQ
ncbi:MAG: hypothetical protein PHC98_03145 [Syntrophotalea acetylenica]|uniref:HEPN domain-containing protein n=1 Tax=Syntrophotalea acetylenica TaxID=29542 RepID=A0A1L3GDI6_SYNAC|nr:hypothetical protein [Syntrophotalea acetylenica]APG24010.1 hypothetical protein A7E75_02465 [Syntrophotalea acetylenica]APG44593.1 hypothetical protein A6070_11085 [Syntrophotalea acetylenica]MDD4456562.1 hypothetical protein [Syntrophotalea acetylenica]